MSEAKLRRLVLRLDAEMHREIVKMLHFRAVVYGDETAEQALVAVCRDWFGTQADLLRERRA